MASFAVALSAKAVLTVRVQRGPDRAGAEDNTIIGHRREQSPPESCFDRHQRAILRKWQQRFEGMYEHDSLIAA